jgi:hypothetical protein
MGLTIRELMRQAYETAAKKGWHDRLRSPLEFHALIHSEISEATEAVRDGLPPFQQRQIPSTVQFQTLLDTPPGEDLIKTTFKPEGEVVELADVIIRIADYCESLGYDLEGAIEAKLTYNQTRGYRHGGKRY